MLLHSYNLTNKNIGATIRVLHDESGTEYACITNSKGYFSLSGLRIGGSRPGQKQTHFASKPRHYECRKPAEQLMDKPQYQSVPANDDWRKI